MSIPAIASGETACQYQRSLLEKPLVNTSDRFLEKLLVNISDRFLEKPLVNISDRILTFLFLAYTFFERVNNNRNSKSPMTQALAKQITFDEFIA